MNPSVPRASSLWFSSASFTPLARLLFVVAAASNLVLHHADGLFISAPSVDRYADGGEHSTLTLTVNQ